MESSKAMNVTAAIIKNTKGEVLIARRKVGKKLAGYWEFPGGKIEEGETPEESLARELKEEMNLNVRVKDFIGENIHHYEGFSIRLMAYETVILEGDMKLTDHDAVKWVSIEEIGKADELAPADVPLVKTILQMIPDPFK
jgi:8-oxo-dGTP diphosphatase